MKNISRFILLIILLSIPFSEAYSFEGPLQIKNQYPIFIHADQPYLEKAEMENSFSLSLSHSSTYTVQESGHWTIHQDMEITEFNFRYKRIIKDFIEFNLDVPVLIMGGGFMDSFVEGYHDTFGFRGYGRENRPRNEFLYEVREDGELIVQGKSGVRFGDIRLAVKKPLYESNSFTLSIRGDLEIPVDDGKEGYSNGSIDSGVSFLIDKRITDNIMSYLNFGVVFTGDVKGHKTLDIDDFIYGGLGVEGDIGKGLSIIIQVQGQSSIYPETDLLAVDRDSYILSLGGRYKTGRSSFDLSLAEDINAAGAADFIVNLTYKVNL